jgi:hypothetical protein
MDDNKAAFVAGRMAALLAPVWAHGDDRKKMTLRNEYRKHAADAYGVPLGKVRSQFVEGWCAGQKELQAAFGKAKAK